MPSPPPCPSKKEESQFSHSWRSQSLHFFCCPFAALAKNLPYPGERTLVPVPSDEDGRLLDDQAEPLFPLNVPPRTPFPLFHDDPRRGRDQLFFSLISRFLTNVMLVGRWPHLPSFRPAGSWTRTSLSQPLYPNDAPGAPPFFFLVEHIEKYVCRRFAASFRVKGDTLAHDFDRSSPRSRGVRPYASPDTGMEGDGSSFFFLRTFPDQGMYVPFLFSTKAVRDRAVFFFF